MALPGKVYDQESADVICHGADFIARPERCPYDQASPGAIASLLVGGGKAHCEAIDIIRSHEAGRMVEPEEPGPATGTGRVRGTTTEHSTDVIGGRIAMLRLGHEPAGRRHSGRSRPNLLHAL